MKIIKELSKYKLPFNAFINFIKDNKSLTSRNINDFLTDTFESQLGIILLFVETKYNLSIYSDLYGYIIRYTDTSDSKAFILIEKQGDPFLIKKYFDNTFRKDSILDTYKEAIVAVFEYIEEPF